MRVREYKEMVHSIHEAGLGVIMDVVYNHTFNVHDSCFYKTAGNYFYRMLDAAKYSDASACGNEIASEKPMVRNISLIRCATGRVSITLMASGLI